MPRWRAGASRAGRAGAAAPSADSGPGAPRILVQRRAGAVGRLVGVGVKRDAGALAASASASRLSRLLAASVRLMWKTSWSTRWRSPTRSRRSLSSPSVRRTSRMATDLHLASSRSASFSLTVARPCPPWSALHSLGQARVAYARSLPSKRWYNRTSSDWSRRFSGRSVRAVRSCRRWCAPRSAVARRRPGPRRPRRCTGQSVIRAMGRR